VCLAAALLPCVPASALSASWQPRAPLSTPRYAPAGVSDGGFVYALGGAAGVIGTPAYTSGERYNPATNAWSPIAPMSTRRYDFAAAVDTAGRIYAIAGCAVDGCPTGSFEQSVERYDPATDAWQAVAPLPHQRWDFAAATGGDGRIYVIGGFNKRAQVVSTVFAYNPASNTWARVAPLPHARRDLAAAVSPAGDIYAIGGALTPCCAGTSEVDVYSPATRSWQQRAPLENARAGLCAEFGPSGVLYAIGGANGAIFTDIVEAYDPATDTWATAPSLPETRASMGCVRRGRVVYAFGGQIAFGLGPTDLSDALIP
jgi:kelch-like protein 17 (actinfilin)/kelch-like protein 20